MLNIYIYIFIFWFISPYVSKIIYSFLLLSINNNTLLKRGNKEYLFYSFDNIYTYILIIKILVSQSDKFYIWLEITSKDILIRNAFINLAFFFQLL